MIDDVFERHRIRDEKYYSLTRLFFILSELGLTQLKRDNFTHDWFQRKVKAGKIVLPEKTTKKWFITGRDLKGIVLAFKPGGNGFYNHES